MQNKLINYKKEYINTQTVTSSLSHLFTSILRNVTNPFENRQLSEFTCFIIHVGLYCIGEKAHA